MLLSSIESRVADINTELEVEDKDITGYEGHLHMQQLLVEIKDEDKEHLFAEQIDESSKDGTGHMIQ